MTTTNKTFSAFTLLAVIIIVILLLLKNCSREVSSPSNDYSQGEETNLYTEDIDSLEEVVDIHEDIADTPRNEPENNTNRQSPKRNSPPTIEESNNEKTGADTHDSRNFPPISTEIVSKKPEKKKTESNNPIVNAPPIEGKPPINTAPKLNTRGNSPSNSPSSEPKKLPPPYNYNKKNLAEDLMKCTPNLARSPLPEFIKKLQYSSASNLIITGEFSDGTDEYKLKNYISHLRNTGPYDIDVFDIKKDNEGRIVEIELKETQINSSKPKYNNPKRKPLTRPQPQLPTPYNYSMKSLAADFMELGRNQSGQIIKLKERIQEAFASNAIILGEFSDGTTQYKLNNYIIHIRTTGPYNVKIQNMEKDKNGKVVSIRLMETQVD